MNWREILTKAVAAGLQSAMRTTTGSPSKRRRSSRNRSTHPKPRHPESTNRRYPGDFTGVAEIVYSPREDGKADPGEIVWAWVPYEEDHSHGKDRPTLVIGRDRAWLLALMLTSQDHDRDAAQERAAGRHWFDIGRGDWDAKGRPSEVRTDRILRLDGERVRRIGGRLDRERFEAVAAEVQRVNRW